MNSYIDSLAADWLSILWRASLHGAVAIAIVLIAAVCLARIKTPAWVENWLWRLVFVKLLLAIVITQAVALPLLPPQPITAVAVQDDAANQNISVSPLASDANPDPNHLIAQPAQVIVNDTSVTASWRPGWQWMVAALWLIGATITAVVLSRQLLFSWRIRRETLSLPWLHEACRQRAAQLGITQVPQLALCDTIASPALVGFFRPTIVFPTAALQQCSEDQLRSVLAHELAHYQRADLWWNLLPALARVFFYFHPLVWLGTSRWRLSSEMACDAAAIDHPESSAAKYAESLLRIAVIGSHRLQSDRLLGCVSVLSSSRSLKQRMVAMKENRRCSSTRAMLYAACIAMVGLLGTVPWKMVSRAAEPSDAKIGQNMSFEESSEGLAEHWGGGGNGYELRLDKSDPQAGKASARITGGSERGFGTYTQCIDATDLRGKRIAYRGFLKSDVQGDGGLWMRIDADQKAIGFDNMSNRRIKGETAWTEYEIVLDVPAKATKICFGFLLSGKGVLWADELSIQVAGKSGKGPRETGSPPKFPSKFTNNGFDKPAKGDPKTAASWGGGGKGYTLQRDEQVKRSGKASGRIQQVDAAGVFGTFTQVFAADDYHGKRVQYTGYLKTDDAQRAGLWMRVDGAGDRVLAFDNMQTRAVTGSTAWTKYTVDLDVSVKAEHIAIGFLLGGSGTVWGDDLELNVAGNEGKSPKSTKPKTAKRKRPTDLSNGNFEKKSAKNSDLPDQWGGGGDGYELVRDEKTKHSGSASGRIEQKKSSGKFGTFTQMFPADKYRGKRVRLRGYLKTEAANASGLWMRVDGPERRLLAFDNMQDRPITGNNAWEQHDVVLDVPEEAKYVAIGFLLIGKGSVWGDDLELEVVGNVGEGPATTGRK